MMKTWGRVSCLLAALGVLLVFFGQPRDVHALPGSAVSAAIKVMPLGDSITSGTNAMASYRCLLYQNLKDAGYTVDFVGSVHGQWGIPNQDMKPPAYCNMMDWDEEGHSGWAIYHILSGVTNNWPGNLQTWAAANMPDVVLIHLGTNNFIYTSPLPDVNAAITQMGQVIDTLRAANPRVRIVLAQVIPSLYNATTTSLIPQFNALLPGLAASKYSVVSPIVVVDMYTGFNTSTFYVSDGLRTHPNPTGESWMAVRWQTAFVTVMGINPIQTFIPQVSK
jgi:lysophospholipase L1-like esterase